MAVVAIGWSDDQATAILFGGMVVMGVATPLLCLW